MLHNTLHTVTSH